MRLLALDTSTEACSAALLLGDDVRLRFQLTERSHAELILPMIDGLLAESGLRLTDLDGLAFGRGPGAFTGLRVAAGVAQGLAIGAGLKVVPVSSLAAVAWQVEAPAGEHVLVCNDARMGEIYWAVFEADPAVGAAAPSGEERVSPPERIVVPRLVTHMAGNAFARHPALRDRLQASGLRLHDGLYPRADAVARIGALRMAAGEGVDPEFALPTYVRDDVARPAQAPVTGMS